jgi:hypothetical protein
MEPKIDNIIQSLTIEEKISLLAGKDFWETVPVQSKGVPAIKVISSICLACSMLTSSDIRRSKWRSRRNLYRRNKSSLFPCCCVLCVYMEPLTLPASRSSPCGRD